MPPAPPLPKGGSGGRGGSGTGGDDPLALDIGLILSPKAQEAGSKSPATNPAASALDLGPAGAASSMYGAAFLAAAAEEAEMEAQQERGLDLMAEQLTWHAHETRARAMRRVSTAAVFGGPGGGGGVGSGGSSSAGTVGTGGSGGHTPVGAEGRGFGGGRRRGRLAWLFGGGGGKGGDGQGQGHGQGEERPSPLGGRGQKSAYYGEASVHGGYRSGEPSLHGKGVGAGSGVAGGAQVGFEEWFGLLWCGLIV